MKMSRLQQLFTSKYPNGFIRYGRKPGTVEVNFHPRGKFYTYRATNIEMARTLDLIPVSDPWAEGERIVAALSENPDGVVIGLLIAEDAVWRAWPGPGRVEVSGAIGYSEYEEPIAEYRVARGDDPWARA